MDAQTPARPGTSSVGQRPTRSEAPLRPGTSHGGSAAAAATSAKDATHAMAGLYLGGSGMSPSQRGGLEGAHTALNVMDGRPTTSAVSPLLLGVSGCVC